MEKMAQEIESRLMDLGSLEERERKARCIRSPLTRHEGLYQQVTKNRTGRPRVEHAVLDNEGKAIR